MANAKYLRRKVMTYKITGILALFCSLIAVCFTGTTEACSFFKVTAKDGTIISGRTMEFGYDVKYGLVVVPRDKEFVSAAPDKQSGIHWKTRYGYVANNVFGDEAMVTDGLNEAGLAFSGLWYEADTKWQQIGPGENSIALANAVVGSWILGNFATVDEVKTAIGKIKIFGLQVAQMGATVPMHWAIHDAKGGSIVIECDNGSVHVYDNPLGIMTNAPNFPWMVTNLRNFVGMSSSVPAPKDFAGVKLLPTGHGSGMWGLPGDITPPSRFVRLAVTTHFADQQENAEKALNLAQHIVSSIHIVQGMVVDRGLDGKITSSETTQWSTFRDLTNKVFYFRTYDNFNLRKIDLKNLDFNTGKIKSIAMYGDIEAVKDITDRLK